MCLRDCTENIDIDMVHLCYERNEGPLRIEEKVLNHFTNLNSMCGDIACNVEEMECRTNTSLTRHFKYFFLESALTDSESQLAFRPEPAKKK